LLQNKYKLISNLGRKLEDSDEEKEDQDKNDEDGDVPNFGNSIKDDSPIKIDQTNNPFAAALQVDTQKTDKTSAVRNSNPFKNFGAPNQCNEVGMFGMGTG